MRPRDVGILAFLLLFSAATLFEVAQARRKDAPKVPARIHFSGNLEGELEPCG